ncbi:hypothetical protein GCM10009613_43820 [Pseudonocardia kongjuensis]|uniref:Uncharacterized protein n=1 Tax=Pseudonocardia kongjuensis TaxID=102227 RepID=A0ABN1Y0Z4_9PSEU
MKLTSTLFVSADGVYQGPGAPAEDISGGCTRGGRLVPHVDDELGSVMTGIVGRAGVLLLGRHRADPDRVADDPGRRRRPHLPGRRAP